MCNSQPNVKWGAHISNGGAGHHWPPAGDDPVHSITILSGIKSMWRHKAYFRLFRHVTLCLVRWASIATAAIEIYPNAHQKK